MYAMVGNDNTTRQATASEQVLLSLFFLWCCFSSTHVPANFEQFKVEVYQWGEYSGNRNYQNDRPGNEDVVYRNQVQGSVDNEYYCKNS